MKTWTLLIFIVLALGLISCGGDKSSSTSSVKPAPQEQLANAGANKKMDQKKTNRKGKIIYKQYCIACHGADGKLGVSDATDLSTSTVDMAERINQITNGKGMMTPYKDVLSETQIKDVAEYLDELIKG